VSEFSHPYKNRILCLNAKSGKIVEDFRRKRRHRPRERRRPRFDPRRIHRRDYGPAAFTHDLLIVSTRDEEGPRPAAPGHIRAYDARTGKARWIFHTIPHPGEFGHDTMVGRLLEDGRRRELLGRFEHPTKREAWFSFPPVPAPLIFTAVTALGRISLRQLRHRTESGHRRTGVGTFRRCITTSGITTFPASRHSLPSTHEGKRLDVVAQVSKTGWVYLFERATGKPLYPIEERPVPQSELPGEKTYPTQPFPHQPSALRASRHLSGRLDEYISRSSRLGSGGTKAFSPSDRCSRRPARRKRLFCRATTAARSGEEPVSIRTPSGST